jgi:DNA-binding MarR family transcriptional regulator
VSDETPRLDDQLCFALYAAARAMGSLYQPVLEPLELTYTQYLVMLVLWEQGPVSVKALGERLSLDSGTLTPLLKRMEALGHLSRRRSTEDERVVELHLTPAGSRLRKKAAEVQRTVFCQTQLSMKELVSLKETLRDLTHTLQHRKEVRARAETTCARQ